MSKKPLKILGIIGARSGSKGVPDKNIRHLDGKPLVGRIIEKAKKSSYINRVVVSTDSSEYADIASYYGADVPFFRPKDLSTDRSPEFEYVKHALEWLKENEGYTPDIVVRMMSTVPLQSVEDIDACIAELLKDPDAQSAVVISESHQHPIKALKLIDDKKGGKYLVTYFEESGREVTPLARQSYEKAYFRANIIAFRTEVVAETDSLTGDRVRYHIISQDRAVDIDSTTDFYIAEQLIKHLNIGDSTKETENKNKTESTTITNQDIEKTLLSRPKQGKNLLEPLKSIAIKNQVPFKILEDSAVVNEAEVHMNEGDLWSCLQGTVIFTCGGELVNPRMRKNNDGTNNESELVATKIKNGKKIILKKGDWLWIPPGEPHQHECDGVARLIIVKIPKK